MVPSGRSGSRTAVVVSLLATFGLSVYFLTHQVVCTMKQSPQQETGDISALQRTEPLSYEAEDLFYHHDLVGKDMADPAVIRAAMGALIPPSNEGPLFLDNPRAQFYSQHKQDEHIKKIFGDKKGGFFFEVGALTGESMSNTLHLERDLGWTGVLMEPTPISYHVLKSKNRRSYLMKACLGTTTTYTEPAFDIGRIAWGNTLLDAHKATKTMPVPCYPLYSVLAALGNPIVDYMSLDVKGVEMKVLQSIPWHLVHIRLMTIKIVLLPEGRGAVRKFMEDKGFKFVKQLNQDFMFVNPKLSEGLNLTV